MKKTLASLLFAFLAATCLADDLLESVLHKEKPAAEPQPEAVPPSNTERKVVPPPAALDAIRASSELDETQLRHELQEMRTRSARLEAALGKASASGTAIDNPAPISIPSPSWTFSVRGGGGSGAGPDEASGTGTGDAISVCSELIKSIGDSSFDIAFRVSYMRLIYHYRAWRRWDEWDEDNYATDLQLLWKPLRDAHISPYAGLGGRAEILERRRNSPTRMETVFTISGRVGLVLYVPGFERLSLKGEFIIAPDSIKQLDNDFTGDGMSDGDIPASESNELMGEVALRLGQRFVIAGFVDSFDIGFDKRSTTFGGGFSLLF